LQSENKMLFCKWIKGFIFKIKKNTMKKDIHPETYRKVVFKDISNDVTFITQSCAPSKETIQWEDGNEYPLIKLEITSASHPFFTGKMKFVDTAGRIDKFNKKFAKFGKKKPAAEEVKEEAPQAEEVKAEAPKAEAPAPEAKAETPAPEAPAEKTDAPTDDAAE